MTKTKRSRYIRKPLKVYALLRVAPAGIIGLYRRRDEAEIDQQYIKETTHITELYLEDRVLWMDVYKRQMEMLEAELKDTERRINKQHDALRSALACGEESPS